MDEQQTFREWAKRQKFYLPLTELADNSTFYYADPRTFAAWEAWQARAALQTQERAPSPGGLRA